MNKEKLSKRMNVWSKVTKETLSKEMAQQASRVFWVGEQKANAEYELDRAKSNLKVVKAKVEASIRKRASKKPTEKEIEGRVAKHDLVCKAADLVAEKKRIFNILWAAQNSLNSKGEQMTNMAYNYRKELDAGNRSRVREESAKQKSKNIRRRRQRNGKI